MTSPDPAPEKETEFVVPMASIKAVDYANSAMRTYGQRDHCLAALRCALGDAAALCDVIAKGLLENGRGRNGRTTKEAREASAVAKMCGDDIWKMRELITSESAAALLSPSKQKG